LNFAGLCADSERIYITPMADRLRVREEMMKQLLMGLMLLMTASAECVAAD